MQWELEVEVVGKVRRHDDGSLELVLPDFIEPNEMLDGDPRWQELVATSDNFALVTIEPTQPDRYETDIAQLVRLPE